MKVYKILLVTGIITSEHDPRVNRMLKRLLESTGRFEVKITEEFRGATAETVEGYDAILINYDGKADVHAPYVPLGKTAEKTIIDFVANGGGVIFYHSSAIANEEEFPEEFIKMIGGQFSFFKGGRKSPWLSLKVDTKYGDPICQDLPECWFTAQEDFFPNIQWLDNNNVEILATIFDDERAYDVNHMQAHLRDFYSGVDFSKMENMNKDHAVIWKNTYEKGRVFVPFIGHGPDTIRRAEFVALMARGCEWVCSGQVTIPFPDIQQENRLASWPYYDAVTLKRVSEISDYI